MKYVAQLSLFYYKPKRKNQDFFVQIINIENFDLKLEQFYCLQAI